LATLQDPTMADEEASRDGAVKMQAVARAGDDGAWPVCSDTHVAAGLQRGWTSWEVLAGIAVPGRASPCRREARSAVQAEVCCHRATRSMHKDTGEDACVCCQPAGGSVRGDGQQMTVEVRTVHGELVKE